MEKPVLIIMAAGLGSRYGGLKQMAPVDDAGHLLIDFSMYDALRAGFETVVCVIAPRMEDIFREQIGSRVAGQVNLRYAHQLPDALPPGYSFPEGREKPWGTAHAVLSAKEQVKGPFAVINADDFYGVDAFKQIYGFLTSRADSNHHAMVGYRIENTLTENGSVSRGICETEGDKLLTIHERTHIEPRSGGAAYTEDGEHFTFLPDGTIVSMNLWGFGAGIMTEIEQRFETFLSENITRSPLKCEYYLPAVPNALLLEKKAEVTVLKTSAKWLGVTYPDDMPAVRGSITGLKESGAYPTNLWQN